PHGSPYAIRHHAAIMPNALVKGNSSNTLRYQCAGRFERPGLFEYDANLAGNPRVPTRTDFRFSEAVCFIPIQTNNSAFDTLTKRQRAFPSENRDKPGVHCDPGGKRHLSQACEIRPLLDRMCLFFPRCACYKGTVDTGTVRSPYTGCRDETSRQVG